MNVNSQCPQMPKFALHLSIAVGFRRAGDGPVEPSKPREIATQRWPVGGQALPHRPACKLLLKPPHLFAPDSVPDKESRAIPATQGIAATCITNIKMWVIESFAVGLQYSPLLRSCIVVFICSANN